MKPKFVLKPWLETTLMIAVMLQFACMTGINDMNRETVVFLAIMFPLTMLNVFILVNYSRSCVER